MEKMVENVFKRHIRKNKVDQFLARFAEFTNGTKKKKRRPNESVGEIENAIQFSWYAPFRIELYAFKAVVDVFTAINSPMLRLLCRIEQTRKKIAVHSGRFDDDSDRR